MSRLQNADLIRADRAVENIISLTLNAMAEAQNAGMSDDELLLQLWKNFMDQADKTSVGAATLHMAMSCYKLAIAADEMHSLREQLDFHKDAIEMITELSNLD